MIDVSGIENLGIDRVLRRGSGEVIIRRDDALIIRDTVSGAYMFACEDTKKGIELLDRTAARNCDLLMVSNEALGKEVFERYGFSEKLECYQVAYYGEKPDFGDGRLNVRTADEHDLPTLIENYRLISPRELEKAVGRGSIMLGYHRDRLVGFIGEHLEGSMGMLYVFPEYRHRGFAAELQKRLIAKTMGKGYIPFGQVEKGNCASLSLQKKLGMTQSDRLIVWMWK